MWRLRHRLIACQDDGQDETADALWKEEFSLRPIIWKHISCSSAAAGNRHSHLCRHQCESNLSNRTSVGLFAIQQVSEVLKE